MFIIQQIANGECFLRLLLLFFVCINMMTVDCCCCYCLFFLLFCETSIWLVDWQAAAHEKKNIPYMKQWWLVSCKQTILIIISSASNVYTYEFSVCVCICWLPYLCSGNKWIIFFVCIKIFEKCAVVLPIALTTTIPSCFWRAFSNYFIPIHRVITLVCGVLALLVAYLLGNWIWNLHLIM